jgi:DNA-binding HxlR family transcriptional regulator
LGVTGLLPTESAVDCAIRCLPMGQVYAGCSRDAQDRWAFHRAALRRGTHHNAGLQAAWRAHGESTFRCEVLEIVAAASELGAAERAWIARLDARNAGAGFNVLPGGLRGDAAPVALVGVVDETQAQFQHAVELLGRRWVGAILSVLLDGPCRFNELLARIPNLSDRLLTERLREPEAAGMVTREVQPGPPVRVIYTLTDAGRSLTGIIRDIATSRRGSMSGWTGERSTETSAVRSWWRMADSNARRAARLAGRWGL